jgi:hypothetical protein
MDCQSAPLDPDLAMLIDRWPTLPEAVRHEILKLAARDTRGGLEIPTARKAGNPCSLAHFLSCFDTFSERLIWDSEDQHLRQRPS